MLTLGERLAAARTHAAADRREEALFLLDEILDVRSDFVEALNLKGALLLAVGRFQEGEICLAKAAQLAPDDSAVLGNLAAFAQTKGDLDRAVTLAEKAYNAADEPHVHAHQLATIYILLARLDDAERVLQAAISHAPKDPDLLNLQADVALRRQNPAAALALLEAALEQRPDSIQALVGIANLRCVLDQPEDAIAHAKKAHLLAPREAGPLYALAKCTHLAGQLSAASDLTSKLVTQFPDYEPGRLLKARVTIDRGQGAQALAEIAKWMRNGSNQVDKLADLAGVLAAAGAWQKVAELAARAPADMPDRAVIDIAHATALLALGQFSAAWDFVWKSQAKDELSTAFSDESDLAVCQIQAAPDLLSALVLLRAVAAWAPHRSRHLSVPAVLGPLAHRLDTSDTLTVHEDTGPLPPQQTPSLLMLAAHLWKAQASPPVGPYLAVSETGRQKWLNALAEFPRPWIGTFWAARSPELILDWLQMAFEAAPGTPISLQRDAARHQLRTWPDAIDAGCAVQNTADWLDLVSCMDLIVGPDGVPMHLAGACNVRGVVLLNENCPWYWHGQDASSTWYPSIQRIVKPSGPDWQQAIVGLKPVLETLSH